MKAEETAIINRINLLCQNFKTRREKIFSRKNIYIILLLKKRKL